MGVFKSKSKKVSALLIKTKPAIQRRYYYLAVFFLAIVLLPIAGSAVNDLPQLENNLNNTPPSLDIVPPDMVSNLTADPIVALAIAPPCGSVRLVPTINAMGVNIDSPVATADHISLRYRQSGSTNWTNGHDGVLVKTGRISGSLFWLTASTSYDVEITTRDLAGNPIMLSQCTSTTQPEILVNSVTTTLNVLASAAPGGNGNVGQPFKTIQAAIAVAQPGDEILVQAGVYHEQLSFPRSGSVGAYIKITGQPGAILDGADASIEQNGLTWTQNGSTYSAPLAGTTFATINPTAGWRDAERSYEYSSLANLQSGTGSGSAGSVPMAEGWFADGTTHTLYVRSLTNPASHTWHFPVASSMATRITQNYLWIEGLTIKFYNYGSYIPKGAHLVFRNNTFQVSEGIQADNSQSIPTDIRIEGNTFSDAPIGDWAYEAVKGRSNMEAAAITFYDGQNLIIRDNRIEQYNNGIQPGGVNGTRPGWTGVGVQEADVYRNIIRHTSDDGMELDGTLENVRVWGNAVDDTLSSLSLAPNAIGPAWILYNRFTQFTARGLKFGGDASGVPGIGFLYHNTVWSNVANATGTQQVAATENDVYTFRNNIIRTADVSIRWTLPVPGMRMDYDNVSSTHVNPYYWNATYADLATVCSAQGAECHGLEANPQLVDPLNGNFGLTNGSPNIDTALLIPGINNNFIGAGPDRGYIEQGQAEIAW